MKLRVLAIGLLACTSLFVVFRGLKMRSREEELTWRFVCTGDRLFALSYLRGTPTASDVLTTDDYGQTWKPISIPPKLCAIASRNDESFALASDGTVWRSASDQIRWNAFAEAPSEGPTPFHSLAVFPTKDILLVGPRSAVLLDRNGIVLNRAWATDSGVNRRELFTNCFIVEKHDQFAVVEASPFAVLVFDLSKRQLVRWEEGLAVCNVPGLHGPCRVRQHGDRFLLVSHDGVYIAEGLLERWRKHTAMRIGEVERGEVCRDIASLDASSDRWLMAHKDSIDLYQGQDKLGTAYVNTSKSLSLIVSMTGFRDRQFVSFARTRNSHLGAVISWDLDRSEAVSFNTQR